MNDFISYILSADIPAILGEDLLAPTVAAIAATWAIIAFASVAEAFKLLLLAIFNLTGGRKW